MKQSLSHVECEIVNQILISELCFDICHDIYNNNIDDIQGRGDDFIPFYYNLNFIKGVLSLHSLLLSNEVGELSIKNYIKKITQDGSNKDVDNFKKEIFEVSKNFKAVIPVSLRHKIAAHIDEGFAHSDFSCAYIAPNLIPKYQKVAKNLKQIFFKFTGWSLNNYPHGKIRDQSNNMVEMVLKLKV